MTKASLLRRDGSLGRAPETEATPSTLAELRAALRLHSQTAAQQAAITLAESVTMEAMRTWWRIVSGDRLALRPRPSRKGAPFADTVRASVEQFGAAAATLPLTDAAHHLSLLYTSMLPESWRARHGIHYTPPPLAERLLDQAEQAGLDWSSATILDPAAGAGAFLIPAAQRMQERLGDCTPAIALQNITARIRGYELDGFAAWMVQVFLDAALLPLTAGGGRARPSVEVCDALNRSDKDERFDLVIGNPPFGRLQLPPQQRARFARSLYGHANLYGIFMDLAVRHARPGGLVSFLTPSSFLAGEYFKNLRDVLWHEAPPVAVDFVTLRKGVFEDVLQETVLATYRKRGVRQAARVSFIHPEPGQQAVPEPAGELTLPGESTAPWLMARHHDEAGLVERLRRMPDRLIDWGYKISTGPLVWNRFKDQLRDGPGKDRVPLVWAESVTSDGRFVFRSEKRNHKPFFLIRPGDEWMIVRKPCVLLQRTTAKEQARRLIAAEMPSTFLASHGSVTVENHLNMLLPIDDRPLVPPTLLACFLSTPAADRAFRCISGSVAVSAYELENLPVPDATELRRLVGRHTTKKAVSHATAILYGEIKG
jgi:adenine-specific DNA-methyltransferase